MQQSNQKPQQTIHQAIFHSLQKLAKQMQPVAQLAHQATAPNEPDPIKVMIELLRQVVGGIEQVQSRLEALESRLDEPAVTKAIKGVARG
jgi:hypothetical protein